MMFQALPNLVMHTFLALGVIILVASYVGESVRDSGLTLGPSPAPGPAFAPGPAPESSALSSGLEIGFYKGKCDNVAVDVEAIVAIKIQEAFVKDPTILPAMLRLQFHDCFVHGCDASILISGNSTEKTAGPNSSVRGYEVIEAIKASIEAECPGVVSCADVTAVATTSLIELGGGPAYSVETGRRDGLVSNSADVDLPSPTMTVPESIAFFAARNFTAEEMVALLGYHAVGITHCGLFEDRLYKTNSQFDAQMDTSLRTQLTNLCPEGSFSDNITPLNQDPKNNNTVDNTFYKQLRLNRGILSLDQALSRHPETSDIVLRLSLNSTLFNVELAKAMRKLQAFQVLTGDQGEIRKVCSKIN